MTITIPTPIIENFGDHGEKLAIFMYPKFVSVYLIDIQGKEHFLYRKARP